MLHCAFSVRGCDAGDNSPNRSNAHHKDPFDPSLCSPLSPDRTMVCCVGTAPLLLGTEFLLLTAVLPSSPGFPGCLFICSQPRFSRPHILVAPRWAVQYLCRFGELEAASPGHLLLHVLAVHLPAQRWHLACVVITQDTIQAEFITKQVCLHLLLY